MARGSRHKSHRSHKHRDRSDSDSEEEARVSRASEPTEKRRSSSNGDFSGENGKKRKDRTEDTVAVAPAPDRWNGGGGREEDGKVEKEPKKDLKEAADAEKMAKPKASSADLKGKHRGSSERNKEKRMSEESSRRESSGGQYKDGKERERERGREGALEKDKKAQESRNERSDDVGGRKEDQVVKKDVVSSELQEEVHNPELEKELEKRMERRRDGSGDNDNLHGDGKESEAKRVLSSKDDHSKNGSYKDERYKDGRYREKFKDDLERVQRLRDDKRRDEYTSRIHATDQSDNKHSRDENRLSESRYKAKVQNSDRDGSPHVYDRGTKLKDNRGRKRSSDEIEDSSDVKPQTMKESWEDTERNGSRSNKLGSHSDRGRGHPHRDKVDSGLSSSRPKSSPGSSSYSVKDQTRHSSGQAESSRRGPLPEEACRPRTTSRADYHGASGGHDRVPESRSMEKTKLKDDIRSDVLLSEAAASHYDKTLRSDIGCSPDQLTEKSPTSTSDRRSERSAARRSLDVEELGQRSSTYKDGRDLSFSKYIGRERELPKDKLKVSGSSQVDFLNNQSTPHGPSSYNRTGNIQGTSPGHLPPPLPVRLGVDSSSVLGKPNSLYTRSSDVGARGGTAWKNNPTWSPAANGFMPLQQGPPAGFHRAVQQYPVPPIYGIRPSMDLNHTMVSYHPHEASRFSSHARPYGWHNSLDDCPPHLQLWDGSNNMIGDESHMYGRLDWDQNRHLKGNRGWEMNVDMWNGQNRNTTTEFSVPQKEQEYSKQDLADETWAGHCSGDDRAGTELPVDATLINRSSDTSPAKNTLGTPAKNTLGTSRKALYDKISEPSKMLSMRGISEKRSDSYARFCCNYLSKLDISPDLVQPELYEQCISSLGTRNGILASNVSMQISKSQDARVAAKSKTYFLNSRYSSRIDAIFQTAMCLYKKQRDAMKEATNTGLQLGSSQEDKIPSASDGAKVNVNSSNGVEEDLPMVGVASAFPREVEEKTSTDNALGNRPEDDEEKHDCPTDTEEKCDNISESVVLAEGPEDHEALMPECMVNISRIHHSPESTH